MARERDRWSLPWQDKIFLTHHEKGIIFLADLTADVCLSRAVVALGKNFHFHSLLVDTIASFMLSSVLEMQTSEL